MKAIGILFALVALIALGIGVWLLLSNDTKGTPSQPVIFPDGGSVSTTEYRIPVSLTDGREVSIPDFSQVDKRPNASREAGYEVAGSNTSLYQILYFPDGDYVLISLQSEPLGEARRAAEAELRARFGLTDDELCNLNYEVRTSFTVNAEYSGTSLGMSFCPGAVALP